MSLDRTKLLPVSGIGADGPWLVVAPPGNLLIRVNSEMLDRIDVRRRRSSKGSRDQGSGCDIVLSRGDVDVALYVAEGDEAAKSVVEQLRSFSASAVGTAGFPEFVIVGDDVVTVRDDSVQIGKVAFSIGDVRHYAENGANLPLPGGRLIQAAIVLLVCVAAEQQPNKKNL